MQRLFAPERTREELRALLNGDLGTAAGWSDLVRLALRQIVEETLGGEVSDALGRERYERDEGEKPGSRNDPPLIVSAGAPSWIKSIGSVRHNPSDFNGMVVPARVPSVGFYPLGSSGRLRNAFRARRASAACAPDAQPRGQGPHRLWSEFKSRVAACYQTPSRAIARRLPAGIRADYADVLARVRLFCMPTCACRSRIGASPGRPTCSNGCSSRSGEGSKSSRR